MDFLEKFIEIECKNIIGDMLLLEYIIVCIILLLLVVASLTRKGELVTFRQQYSLIDSDTSIILKAICCIVIIMHHYALRVYTPIIGEALAVGGGNCSLVIFLVLSSYGIAKSEYTKPLNFLYFLKKRVSKIIIPYVIFLTFFYVIYRIIGASPSLEDMKLARVTPSFADIGSHSFCIVSYFRYLFGLDSFCGHLWFVGIILYHYLAFYISKKLFDIRTQKRKCIILYVILIIIFGVFVYMCNLPTYLRNLWPLILGLHFALYEDWYRKNSRLTNVFVLFVFNIIFVSYIRITDCANWIYVILGNIGVLMIFLFNIILQKYIIKKSSLIVNLANISYFIYLSHGMLLTLQWWYLGYNSLILLILSSILLSWLYYYSVKTYQYRLRK